MNDYSDEELHPYILGEDLYLDAEGLYSPIPFPTITRLTHSSKLP